MRHLSLFLIIALFALTPALAKNQTGYPLPETLPETLPAITPENASQLLPLADIGCDLPGDLAWSPNGKTLAVGTTDGVRTFDSTNWDLPPRQLPGWKDVRFDAEGNLISDGKVIDLASRNIISDTLNITPSGKSRIDYRDLNGNAAVVLTDIDSGQETLLNTALDGIVSHVVFSTDEQFAVIVINTHETDQYQRVSVYPAAQLWNASTGTLIASLDIVQSFDHIDTIGFHVQDKLLVIASHWSAYEGYDAYVQIWDGRTGEALTAPDDSDDIPVRFSPDDQLMAFPTWEGVSLWSDHKIGVLGDQYMIPVFSPDGRMLAGYYPSSSIINVWNIETALNLGQPEKELVLTGMIVDEMNFSPDGKLLAISEYNNQVRIWNLETGTIEVVISNITGTIQFSPNSQWILGKREDTARFALWDARTGEKLMDFDENFAINPDWTLAAQEFGQIISLPGGEPIRSLQVLDNYVGKIRRFDATLGHVMFGGQAFDTASGQVLFSTYIDSPLPDYAFSSDWRRMLLVEDRESFNRSRQPLAYVQEPITDAVNPLWFAGDFVTPETKVFLTPDGKFIGYLNRPSSYSGQYNSRLQFRDVETGQHIAEWMLPGDVEAMTISHDGKWLALGSSEYNDGQIILLDLVGDLSKKSLITRPLNYSNRNGGVILSNLTFSPDDSRLAVEGDHRICGDGCINFYFVKSWDVDLLRTENPWGEIFSMSIEAVHAPIFSADGKLLVVTSASGFNSVVNTGAVQLWEMVGNKKVVELTGDDGIATFSPDGRLLVLHEADQSVLYDTAALKRGEVEPVATIDDQDKPVKQLAFNPDGTILYIVSENRLWLYGVGI